MDWFAIENNAFINRKDGDITFQQIRNFKPVSSLIKLSNLCFKKLRELDDESLNEFKWLIWGIRQSIVYSLIRFDSCSLGLSDSLSKLTLSKNVYPAFHDELIELEKIIEYLINHPENPKMKYLEQKLIEYQQAKQTFGIIYPPVKGSLKGWSGELDDWISLRAPRCIFIESRKALLSMSLDNIFLAGTGQHLSYLSELFYSGSRKHLDIIAYKTERFVMPERFELPKGSFNYKNELKADEINNRKITEVMPNDEAQWVGEQFWERFKTKDTENLLEESDRKHIVKARLIILSDDRFIYLKEDQKVIELSEMITKGLSSDEIVKSFPRKKVTHLEEGDYLLMRTDGGSNDYVIEVADKLIRQDGRTGLREKALSWKAYLAEALTIYGSNEIYQRLAKKGHQLSFKDYLWIWTTNDVISPESDSRFYELIGILSDLDVLPDEIEPLSFADTMWTAMKKLKFYHFKAGSDIRIKLLKRFKEILKSSIAVKNGYTLTIPGVDAGSMTVMKVDGINPETELIAYSELNIIKTL